MLDWFETKSEFCLVMEYAQGELFEILEEDRKLSEEQIRPIAIQLASALYYLHSQRIIHRDMKPQNVLIGPEGRVKLCDFGFARTLATSTAVITSVKGTPLYMAPELVQEHPYNHKVDLWSFGIILYELFVGEPPFFTTHLGSLIKLIVKKPVKYSEAMSPDFRDFLSRILVKEPQHRLDWPELLDHPFIRRMPSDLAQEARASKKYCEWLKNLSTWNRAFEATAAETGKNAVAAATEGGSLAEDLASLLRELKSKGASVASRVGAALSRASVRSLTGEEARELGNLVDFLLEDSRGSVLRGLKDCSTVVSGVFERAVSTHQALATRLFTLFLALREAPTPACVEKLGILVERADERLRRESAVTLLQAGAALLRHALASLDPGLRALQVFVRRKLADRLLGRVALDQQELRSFAFTEALWGFAHPACGDPVLFPLRRETNASLRGAELSSSDLQVLDELERSLGQALFSRLEAARFRENPRCEDVFYLKLLLKFSRGGDANLALVVRDKVLLDALAESATSFSHKSPDLQETLLQIFAEVNRCRETRVRIKLEFPLLMSLFDEEHTNIFLEAQAITYLTSLGGETFPIPTLLRHLASFANAVFQRDWIPLLKEDHCSCGFMMAGVLDSLFRLLRQVLHSVRTEKDVLLDTARRINESGLSSLICVAINSPDKPFILSHKGAMASFNLAVELFSLSREQTIAELILREDVLRQVFAVIKESKAANSWPPRFGFSALESSLKTSAIKLLESIVGAALKINKQKLMKTLTNSLRSTAGVIAACITRYSAMLAENHGKFIRPYVLALLLKIPETEMIVATEIVSSNGIDFIARNGGLGLSWETEESAEILSDHISILTQICIASREFYPAVAGLNGLPSLCQIVKSGPDSIREKAARLLGQMCKHSDYFYQGFEEHKLLPELAAACSSSSTGLRRSACLALGNAAFHSAKLYPSIERLLPEIMRLLTDPDDRTRANAVGTLNNLVRNGDSLQSSLLSLGVLEKFYHLALNETAVVSRNLVFFALGNYCKDPKFLVRLKELFTSEDRAKIAMEQETNGSDEFVLYSSRFLAKLEA